MRIERILSRAFPLILFLWATHAVAQDSVAKRHQRFVEYLKKTAAELSMQSLSQIQSLEDWEKQRPVWRQRLLSMLGLDPLPKRTPLKVQVTGSLDRPNYRIEKIVFQSLPRLYVTANFYLPKRSSGRLPTILYLCGHSPHPLGAKWDYQDRAAWFASNGYACLVLDTLEFGEVAGIHHGIHDLSMWHWLSLGYTPAGTEVWNAIRALDYLETRPEVDKDRIGLTGISGGGAITWYTAAVDERVAAAAPVCSTYMFGSQAAHWVASGQCDCIYFHNTYLEDFPIVGALIAPRPLIMMNGRQDPDFPPDGYHEVFRKVKRVYDFYSQTTAGPERVREVDDDVGHSDVPLFLQEARQWMHRWLGEGNDPAEVMDAGQKERAEDLACLTKLPADAINYQIHNLLIPTAALKSFGSLTEWSHRREELLRQLKEQVFRWFPRNRIPFDTHVTRNDGGWAARYADYKDVEFSTELGVRVRAQLLRPKDWSEKPTLLYVKRPGDSIYFLDLDELLPVLGRYNVLILNPRMTEHPVTAFEYAEIERSASWVGRTVASMQVWDILRTIEWAASEEKLPSASISLYGKGDMGILALYAGLFDERVSQVILNNPPGSHWQGAALLNVLRVTDIPEVAAAFAPRQIVSLTPLPESFQHARQIYKLHKQPAEILQAGSLPEALRIWNY